jgi:hypothetical protein
MVSTIKVVLRFQGKMTVISQRTQNESGAGRRKKRQAAKFPGREIASFNISWQKRL